MKYNIIGKNIEVTEGLENAVINKLAKLDKYFSEATTIQVTLSVEKQTHIIEITILFNGHILRAEVDGKDMYALIDDAVAIIEKQANKFKGRFRDKKRNAKEPGFTDQFIATTTQTEEPSLKVAKTKKFAIKPMNTEEAVLQMELVGHNFFVYLDSETEEVNVVYKRRNGTYGLIEPTI